MLEGGTPWRDTGLRNPRRSRSAVSAKKLDVSETVEAKKFSRLKLFAGADFKNVFFDFWVVEKWFFSNFLLLLCNMFFNVDLAVDAKMVRMVKFGSFRYGYEKQSVTLPFAKIYRFGWFTGWSRVIGNDNSDSAAQKKTIWVWVEPHPRNMGARRLPIIPSIIMPPALRLRVHL